MTEPASAPLRLIVVDDQALVRAGFRMILERAGFDVVAEAADGVEAVQASVDLTPDVLLMDIRMPRLDGIEATRAGASGFLLKDVAPADLVHAVHVVHRGEVLLAPALTRRLLERFLAKPPPSLHAGRLDRLTERERGVLKLVASGMSNAEIGAELFLTEATVKTYVSHLLNKLEVRDRVQLPSSPTRPA